MSKGSKVEIKYNKLIAEAEIIGVSGMYAIQCGLFSCFDVFTIHKFII